MKMLRTAVTFVVLTILCSGCGTIRIVDHSRTGVAQKAYVEIYQVRPKVDGAILSNIPLYVNGILVDKQSGNAWKPLSQRTRVTLEPGACVVSAIVDGKGKDDESSRRTVRVKSEVQAGQVRLIEMLCSRKWNAARTLATNSVEMTEGPLVPYKMIPPIRHRKGALTGEAFMVSDLRVPKAAAEMLKVLRYFNRPHFYVTSVSVPYRKLMNICGSCDVDVFTEKVLGFIDTTSSGSASDGLLFTIRGVHAKNSVMISDPPLHKFWTYKELSKLAISNRDSRTVNIGGFRLNTSNSKIDNKTLVWILQSVQRQARISHR